MTAKLTLKDVVDWAVARGFAEDGRGGYAIPFKKGVVRIEPLTRNFRVSVEIGDQRQVLATPHPSRLHIDEFGMLAGAALSSSFAQRARREEDLPPWFTEEYKAAVRQRSDWERAAPPPGARP